MVPEPVQHPYPAEGDISERRKQPAVAWGMIGKQLPESKRPRFELAFYLEMLACVIRLDTFMKAARDEAACCPLLWAILKVPS